MGNSVDHDVAEKSQHMIKTDLTTADMFGLV
jgi:hypothetical protein